MKNRNIKEKAWYEIEADGRVIGILEESKSTEGEIARYKNLLGVTVRPASADSMMKYNAKTTIPRNLVDRFYIAWHEAEAKRKKYSS